MWYTSACMCLHLACASVRVCVCQARLVGVKQEQCEILSGFPAAAGAAASAAAASEPLKVGRIAFELLERRDGWVERKRYSV